LAPSHRRLCRLRDRSRRRPRAHADRRPAHGAVAALPLALVPLFGAGLSGASHLVSFDLLRRRVADGADRN
jgi:hypothetical protein